jgi:hypothetical protein
MDHSSASFSLATVSFAFHVVEGTRMMLYHVRRATVGDGGQKKFVDPHSPFVAGKISRRSTDMRNSWKKDIYAELRRLSSAA